MKNNIKITVTISLCGMLMAMLLSWNNGLSQTALHFDGENDFIFLYPIKGMNPDQKNFSVDMWFKLENHPSDCEEEFFRGLFSFYDGYSKFIIGECDGYMRVYYACHYLCPWINPCFHRHLIKDNILLSNDNDWHHIAVVRDGNKLLIFLDGKSVYSKDDFFDFGCEFNPKWFEVGRSNPFEGFSPVPFPKNLFWKGMIDEVRLWNIALSEEQITQINCKPCPINPEDYYAPFLDVSSLIAYWSFQDFWVTPNGNNQGKKYVQDFSLGATVNQGYLIDFDLVGDESNFVNSDALILPSYFHHFIVLRDATNTDEIYEICSGEQVHFSIVDGNLEEPAKFNPKPSIEWEYQDVLDVPDPNNWTPIIPVEGEAEFNGFAFVSLPGSVGTTIPDCSTVSEVNRFYRAFITVGEEPDACVYEVNHYMPWQPLKICCRVVSPSLNITYDGALCEGEDVEFDVNLSNTGLPDPPGSGSVSINWEIRVNNVPISSFSDFTNFQYELTNLSAGKICFYATITNCGCSGGENSRTVSKCFTIDPRPECGDITRKSDNLIDHPLIPGGNDYYIICPGSDAEVKMIDFADFKNCTPVWQYQLDSHGPTAWHDLGSFNVVQNTNVLPQLPPPPDPLPGSPYLWDLTIDENIRYRIVCRPINPNSDCPSCESNVITVWLPPKPVKPVIFTNDPIPICDGGNVLLEVSEDENAHTYYWYLNGNLESQGTERQFLASLQGNYVVVAEDIYGCYRIPSDPFFLQICTVVAKICCPIPDCPCPGDTIKVPGAGSSSTCGGPLTYEWSWDSGELIADNGDHILHLPHENGTTYTLKVTDPYGCEATKSRTVVPCPERPFVCGEPFIDKPNGQIYQTVEIGEQCWMAENLNVGSRIDGNSAQSNNESIEKYCYNDLEANCDVYGGLYQWNEMMQYSTTPGVKGICPEGWHLPTHMEWQSLKDYVNNPDFLCDEIPEYLAQAFAAKSTWEPSNVVCAPGYDLSLNNETGFTALPGGSRSIDGTFNIVGYQGMWWSSSEDSGAKAWRRRINYQIPSTNSGSNDKNQGFSVRCLRD